MIRYSKPFDFSVGVIVEGRYQSWIVKVSQRELDKNRNHAKLLGEKIVNALHYLDPDRFP